MLFTTKIDIDLNISQKKLSTSILLDSIDTFGLFKTKCSNFLNIESNKYFFYISGIHINDIFDGFNFLKLLDLFTAKKIEIRENFFNLIDGIQSNYSAEISKSLIVHENKIEYIQNLDNNISDLQYTIEELNLFEKNLCKLNGDIFSNDIIGYRENNQYTHLPTSIY